MMILTGGPGTGKTTTVRGIIELAQGARWRIKLAAPTGRAARRLAETARLQAETIHRLLGFQAHLGEFARNAGNPIEADLVIVDEVSMLDAPLAASLLEAIAPGAGLLLVGDEDQLPSVGPGNVLGDIIASGVMPMVRLTEVFRQAEASLIVANAHRINHGLMPWLTPPDEATRPDFFFIERDEPAGVVEAIKALTAERIPGKFKLDPRRDVQILTPMRRGELGVEALNAQLKELLNPVAGTAGDGATLFSEETGGDAGGAEALAVRRQVFSPGDRVMQTSNNYDKNVFNGDIGFVEHVDAQAREAVVAYEGRRVSYLADELDQIVLAYATTIHKSQGSEYPAVIIPIHTQHWIMLQRNLIYTALTRGRQLVCMVGTRRALRRAIGNAERARRFTALVWFLAQRERGAG
jgi:exodeoxyribonuclease V alpha subunit